jgi:hypothetical protein
MTNETTSNETITGFCDVCGKRETDSAETLKSEGWHLGRNEQFCPKCNS